MNDANRATVAEFIGTFTLVFVGALAGALAGRNGGGIVAVALAHGVALMVIIYTWGAVSGAHVNPAVTLGVALAGRIGWSRAVSYWVAQFVGAAVAAYLVLYLAGAESGLGATVGDLTPHGATAGDPFKVVVLEAILTFFLVASVFASGIANRNTNLAGVAIGFVLIMDILAGGQLTGASMNPARTFGPALALNDWSYLPLYVFGPALGAAAAALLYHWWFMPEVTADPAAPGKRHK